MRALVLGPPFLALRHARLHDADLDARHEALRRRRQPHLARHRQHDDRPEHDRHRRSPRAPPRRPGRRFAPQHGRQREHQHHQQRQPIDAEHAGALHEGERPSQGIAQHIPGKAREDVPARPLRGGERERQHQNAAGRLAPEAGRNSRRGRVEQREPRRHRRHRHRQQHGKHLGLDEKRLPDPEQPRQEIAEPEPPPDRRRRQHVIPAQAGTQPGRRRLALGRCLRHRAIDQPHQRRQRQPQHRPGEERRHRQHRQRACQQRGEPPAPAAQGPQALLQRLDRHVGRHGLPDR